MRQASSRRSIKLGLAAMALSAPALAQENAILAAQAFTQNCFSPYLTATKARDVLSVAGARHDFYDLEPFSNAAPSPAFGLRPATRGTDRRCEVSFDGDHASLAIEMAQNGLQAEGILKDAPTPETHTPIAGTEMLAARYLNPKRIAVVHVGTRQGPNGIETFMNVERLTPAASQLN